MPRGGSEPSLRMPAGGDEAPGELLGFLIAEPGARETARA